MRGIHLKGEFSSGHVTQVFNVDTLLFQEDDNYIYYCAALDLSGYGKSETEARESFEEALHQFVDYCTNKKTMVKTLTDLGWIFSDIRKKRKSASAPPLFDLLKRDEYLTEVFNTKQFHKQQHQVELPAFA